MFVWLSYLCAQQHRKTSKRTEENIKMKLLLVKMYNNGMKPFSVTEMCEFSICLSNGNG